MILRKDNLVTIQQCMERLSCSRTFIYHLLDKGLLESRKLGKSRRIVESSLDKLLKEGYEND